MEVRKGTDVDHNEDGTQTDVVLCPRENGEKVSTDIMKLATYGESMYVIECKRTTLGTFLCSAKRKRSSEGYVLAQPVCEENKVRRRDEK
ncbi:hypothetical protein Trydic_g3696 [Trypoxylus dichotomus]